MTDNPEFKLVSLSNVQPQELELLAAKFAQNQGQAQVQVHSFMYLPGGETDINPEAEFVKN